MDKTAIGVWVGTTLCGFVCPHVIKLPSLPDKWCQALLFSLNVNLCYLYVVICFLSCIHFSTFIRRLFPDDIHSDKRGRPTTVGSKIRVNTLSLQCVVIWNYGCGVIKFRDSYWQFTALCCNLAFTSELTPQSQLLALLVSPVFTAIHRSKRVAENREGLGSFTHE